MTNGIKALRQIQISRETTQGTATTDFTIWRGLGSIQDDREMIFVDENIGLLPGSDRNYAARTGGTLELEETEATFEQAPYIFQCGIYKATPAADGGGSGYVYTWTWPELSSDAKATTDLETLSVKAGDNQEVEKASFGFIPAFAFTGTGGEALRMSATLQTREVSADTDGFVTVTIPTVEEILFSKGKLYINNDTDAFGTTQVSQTLLGMQLNVTTGWQAVFAADGRSDFSFVKQVQPEITLDITFEHNASASTEKAAWRAETARLIRLQFEGAALGTGATYTYKTLRFDLAGKWERFEKLGDRDGNDIVTGTFRARYNATAAAFAEFLVVNELSALP